MEMKNSQIAAAGMLCNLTANFLNNKKSFLSAAGNSGMKHATDLAVRVLQSNLADDNVRLAIPLLGTGLILYITRTPQLLISPKKA